MSGITIYIRQFFYQYLNNCYTNHSHYHFLSNVRNNRQHLKHATKFFQGTVRGGNEGEEKPDLEKKGGK